MALHGQNGIVEKMKANRPRQALIAIVKPAPDEIANHGKEFVEIFSLGRHFRLVADGHQHVFILFDLKHERFLHAGIVPHKTRSGKCLLPSNSRAASVWHRAGCQVLLTTRPRALLRSTAPPSAKTRR